MEGGRWGGAPRAGSLANLPTSLIWLVTRVGGWGEAWGGGPWRAGKGGDGGQCGLVPPFVTRVGGGEAWGGGPWRAGKGGDGGGHQRAVWEQQKMHWFSLLGA